MANQFDFSNLGAMFGGGMGGTPSGLDALLSEEQRKLLGRNAALSAAGALLQASGRSAVPISMGQALGSALQAGQQGYERGKAGSFQDLLLEQKIKEMKQEAAGNESWRALIGGQGQTTPPLTPDQAAILAPVSVAGKFGPTPERAQLAAQMPVPVATSTDPLAFLNPVQRSLIGGMPRKEGLPEVLKIASSQAEYGKPEPIVLNGKTVMVQYNKLGQSRIAEGAAPYEPLPTDVRAPEYLTGTSLAGTGQAGINVVSKYRQDLAPKTNTNVEVKMPGNQQFLAGVGGDVSKTLNELTMGARTANDSLANIDRILPALDKAIVGPGADYRTAMLRIGQQLGVAGADANEQLANTRVVVQGLAQRELDEAAQMRGQGSLTGPEREILRRAAAGDQTLSAAEIKQALSTAQKVAKYRLSTQQDYLNRASKLPGFEQFAPMYQVTPYGGGTGGGGNPLLNAIDQQLQLRSSGGQR
jgi:hypothetical protein